MEGSGFNTAILKLRLLAVSGYPQSGWQTENTVQLQITRDGNSILITAIGPGTEIELTCGFIDVVGFDGHFRGPGLQ